ncbi:ABC transporter ATP-binding protein [Mesorhizobium sp. CAU 1732]|uniref:ABC transporter ATP-binding protein n=1 Tax=Mesorhizobium sp. CAU 1732 TaxID=3140358 RepID=UPI0032614267
MSEDTAGQATLLEAQGLSKSFAGLRAVVDMSIALRPGELVGLIGPNGAGKTTLFGLITGSVRPDAGTIRLGAADLTHLGPEKRLRVGLGRTFQIPRPFGEMTVLENVLTAVQNQTGESMLANIFAFRKVAEEERRSVDKARSILDFLSLSDLENEPARILSGGQRKLLELARVMITDPKVILLDEPAAGVNPALLDLIIDRIAEINAAGMTILLIEHNMEMIQRLCGRVVVMAQGRRLAEGTPADIARDEEVAGAYLGEPA